MNFDNVTMTPLFDTEYNRYEIENLDTATVNELKILATDAATAQGLNGHFLQYSEDDLIFHYKMNKSSGKAFIGVTAAENNYPVFSADVPVTDSERKLLDEKAEQAEKFRPKNPLTKEEMDIITSL